MAIKITTLKCEHCGYKWIPRIEKVKVCPKCKSYYWNRKNYKRKQYTKARILAKEARTL